MYVPMAQSSFGPTSRICSIPMISFNGQDPLTQPLARSHIVSVIGVISRDDTGAGKAYPSLVLNTARAFAFWIAGSWVTLDAVQLMPSHCVTKSCCVSAVSYLPYEGFQPGSQMPVGETT